MNNFDVLSGYRFMWLLVMFDLPVQQKSERRDATKFRNFLLNNGFEMANYSVYLKAVSSLAQSDTVMKKIRSSVPGSGTVSILKFTDKQFEQMVTFRGKQRIFHQNPDLLTLF